MQSRLRSDSKNKSFVVATTNPDPDSWVLNWVLWYLDKNGDPIPERCGVTRYYLLIDGSPVFANSREELREEYPERSWIVNPLTGEKHDAIKSFAFIYGTIWDNPALIQSNPSYLAELQAQSEVQRSRLLHGNWFARPEGSEYFKREWLNKISKEDLPKMTQVVRAWDKASSEPNDKERFPDFTSCTGMGKDATGRYYILGDFCDENFYMDKDTRINGKFRKRPGPRDKIISKQAEKDGKRVRIVLPKDPGAAGATEAEQAKANLISEGYWNVGTEKNVSNKSKLDKYSPFSSACENGLVYIVEDSFGNRETLEAFYKENEAFDGTDSTRQRKDDWPDSTATAFNELAMRKTATVVDISGRVDGISSTLRKKASN